MKATYTIGRDDLRPPAKDGELALFTFTLQSATLRDWLTSRGVAVPERFEVTHNTGSDDPPDLSALGFGWECTEFPPNQSAIEKVHAENGPMGMVVPGYSQTGSDIRKIREQSVPFTSYPRFVAVNDEITALEDAFLNRVIGGPKSKDVYGNDILLLDRTSDPSRGDMVEAAIKCALRKRTPKHTKLILLVGCKPYAAGDTVPVPQVTQVFP